MIETDQVVRRANLEKPTTFLSLVAAQYNKRTGFHASVKPVLSLYTRPAITGS